MARTSPASWTVAEVEADKGWIYHLSPAEGIELLAAVRRAGDATRPILDWRRDDFALRESIPTLAAAFREVRDGRGMALVRNLPREGATPAEFRLMTWAIGLHFGVARPQNRASDYITEVKDVGQAYRGSINLWGFDAFATWLGIDFGGMFARSTAWVDRNIVDGIVNGAAGVAGISSEVFRRVQTGFVRSYMLVMLLGVCLVIAGILWPLIAHH